MTYNVFLSNMYNSIWDMYLRFASVFHLYLIGVCVQVGINAKNTKTHVKNRLNYVFKLIISGSTLDSEHNWERPLSSIKESTDMHLHEPKPYQGQFDFHTDFCWCFIKNVLIQDGLKDISMVNIQKMENKTKVIESHPHTLSWIKRDMSNSINCLNHTPIFVIQCGV